MVVVEKPEPLLCLNMYWIGYTLYPGILPGNSQGVEKIAVKLTVAYNSRFNLIALSTTNKLHLLFVH